MAGATTEGIRVRVSHERFGAPNCIIFRPKAGRLAAGSTFWVEIAGLDSTGGDDEWIGYLVTFAAI